MRELLLDTHVLIWLVEGNTRLNPDVLAAIDQGCLQDRCLLSAITPWEIAMLAAKKRIDLQMDPLAWVQQTLAKPGLRLIPLLPEIAVESNRLPWEMHPDPADRILVATARHLGAVLVTADELLLGYGEKGYLSCIRAG